MINSIFIDTIKGEKRERPPVWFMRQAGRILPRYLKLREQYSFHELMGEPELAAQVTLLPVDDLGVDAAILFSDILVIPEALGMKLNFSDKGPKFENPLYLSSNPVAELNSDEQKLEHIYQAIDIIKQEKSEETALIGFCGAPFTTFCYMVQGHSANHNFTEAIKLFYNDSKTSDAIFEKITELSIHYATTQAAHGIDAFQLFETHAGLIPSEVYNQRVLPFAKRICNAVREKGVPTIFFPKGLGNGMKAVTHEVADFVSIDWQFSLSEARELIDPRVGLQGNLDPRLFNVENRVILTSALEKLLPFGQANSNWIFNAGHGVSPENAFDNVKYTVDWIKSVDWGRK
jgi:uroporphyrinogen decarboxylase